MANWKHGLLIPFPLHLRVPFSSVAPNSGNVSPEDFFHLWGQARTNNGLAVKLLARPGLLLPNNAHLLKFSPMVLSSVPAQGRGETLEYQVR